MSFSPRNVSQLLVADTTSVDLAAYKAAKAAGTVGAFLLQAKPLAGSGSGDPVNIGAQLIAVTATGGDAVSELVKTADIDSITEGVLEAGALKIVTATYPTPASFALKTFNVTITVNDHIGSPLNERFINAYVACDVDGNFIDSSGALVAGSTNAIVAELDALLASTLIKNNDPFTVSSATNVLTISQLSAQQVVGVKDGIADPFVVTGGYKEDTTVGGTFVSVPAAIAITQESKIDDLVQLKNIEWFNSGYSKDPYRETGYPASFPVAKNLEAAGIAIGDAIVVINFHKDRDATNVERQHRQLIIVGAGATAFKAALDAVTV